MDDIPEDVRKRAWSYLCDLNEDCGQCNTICDLAAGCTCMDRLSSLLFAERERCAKIAEDSAHADCDVAEQIAKFIRSGHEPS